MLSHPLRKVAMTDRLLMVGNHHVPPGHRHWRSDAGAFAITDYRGTPMVWSEGDYIVGDLAVTVAMPQIERGSGLPVEPRAGETLLWFEPVKVGGLPMIRSWWAVGGNIDRTMRRARLEMFDKRTWPEQVRRFLRLMNWID